MRNLIDAIEAWNELHRKNMITGIRDQFGRSRWRVNDNSNKDWIGPARPKGSGPAGTNDMIVTMTPASPARARELIYQWILAAKNTLVERGHPEGSLPTMPEVNVFFYRDRMGTKGKALITGWTDLPARAFYMAFRENTWTSDQDTITISVGNERFAAEYASSQALRNITARQILNVEEAQTIGEIAADAARANMLTDAV